MRKPRSDAVRSFYASLGRNIATARLKHRITQEALAADVGLSRTSIVNIENGKQQVLLHTFFQIAHAIRTEPLNLVPEALPTERSLTNTIEQFVRDPAGQAWISAALLKDEGGSHGN